MRQFLIALSLFFGMHAPQASTAPPAAEGANDLDAAFSAGTALISPHLKLAEQEPSLDGARRKDLEEGIAQLTAVVRADPGKWQANWFIGKAYQALDNHAASHAAFKAAYLVKHGNPDVDSEYGLSCVDLGLGKEAIAAFQRAIKAAPDISHREAQQGRSSSSQSRHRDGAWRRRVAGGEEACDASD